MKTIKLPYKTEYDLVPLMRQYSSVVRYAYRRFLKGKTEKEVRNLTKQKDSIDLLPYWMFQCGIKMDNWILYFIKKLIKKYHFFNF